MDELSKNILDLVGFHFNELNDLENIYIPREQLLSDNKYDEIKILIPGLKKIFSSSIMTSLHKTAEKSQKWPLLNLVRQILHIYNFKMTPIRKADGYLLDGTKKYKRFFLIQKHNKNDKINIDTGNEEYTQSEYVCN